MREFYDYAVPYNGTTRIASVAEDEVEQFSKAAPDAQRLYTFVNDKGRKAVVPERELEDFYNAGGDKMTRVTTVGRNDGKGEWTFTLDELGKMREGERGEKTFREAIDYDDYIKNRHNTAEQVAGAAINSVRNTAEVAGKRAYEYGRAVVADPEGLAATLNRAVLGDLRADATDEYDKGRKFFDAMREQRNGKKWKIPEVVEGEGREESLAEAQRVEEEIQAFEKALDWPEGKRRMEAAEKWAQKHPGQDALHEAERQWSEEIGRKTSRAKKVESAEDEKMHAISERIVNAVLGAGKHDDWAARAAQSGEMDKDRTLFGDIMFQTAQNAGNLGSAALGGVLDRVAATVGKGGPGGAVAALMVKGAATLAKSGMNANEAQGFMEQAVAYGVPAEYILGMSEIYAHLSGAIEQHEQIGNIRIGKGKKIGDVISRVPGIGDIIEKIPGKLNKAIAGQAWGMAKQGLSEAGEEVAQNGLQLGLSAIMLNRWMDAKGVNKEEWLAQNTDAPFKIDEDGKVAVDWQKAKGELTEAAKGGAEVALGMGAGGMAATGVRTARRNSAANSRYAQMGAKAAGSLESKERALQIFAKMKGVSQLDVESAQREAMDADTEAGGRRESTLGNLNSILDAAIGDVGRERRRVVRENLFQVPRTEDGKLDINVGEDGRATIESNGITVEYDVEDGGWIVRDRDGNVARGGNGDLQDVEAAVAEAFGVSADNAARALAGVEDAARAKLIENAQKVTGVNADVYANALELPEDKLAEVMEGASEKAGGDETAAALSIARLNGTRFKDGSIAVFTDNIGDVGQLYDVLWHEGNVHNGIRRAITDKAARNKLFKEISRNVDAMTADEVNARIEEVKDGTRPWESRDDYFTTMFNWYRNREDIGEDDYETIEECLAYLSQGHALNTDPKANKIERGLWRVRSWLRSAGLPVAVTEEDYRFYLNHWAENKGVPQRKPQTPKAPEPKPTKAKAEAVPAPATPTPTAPKAATEAAPEPETPVSAPEGATDLEKWLARKGIAINGEGDFKRAAKAIMKERDPKRRAELRTALAASLPEGMSEGDLFPAETGELPVAEQPAEPKKNLFERKTNEETTPGANEAPTQPENARGMGDVGGTPRTEGSQEKAGAVAAPEADADEGGGTAAVATPAQPQVGATDTTSGNAKTYSTKKYTATGDESHGYRLFEYKNGLESVFLLGGKYAEAIGRALEGAGFKHSRGMSGREDVWTRRAKDKNGDSARSVIDRAIKEADAAGKQPPQGAEPTGGNNAPANNAESEIDKLHRAWLEERDPAKKAELLKRLEGLLAGAEEAAGKRRTALKSVPEAKAGKPFTAKVFHGKGARKGDIYAGAQVPVAGEGTYYAFLKDDAKFYGDDITESELSMRNPYVVRDDNDWANITSKAGWKTSNQIGADEKTIKQNTAALKNWLVSHGFDGIVVQFEASEEGDSNAKTGGSVKTLRDVFGHDQAVSYAAAPARQPEPADAAETDETRKGRIREWLSPDNMAAANGLTREQIFDKFGNDLMPIATIPKGYLPLLADGLSDNRVFSGKGYFIDHAVHHHPEVSPDEYLGIQDIIDTADEVRLDDRNPARNKSLLFIKNIGKNGVVVVSFDEVDNGKIVLHKSFFTKMKKGRFDKMQSVKLSPEVGNPSISHAAQAAPAVRLSALEDNSSMPQSGGNVKPAAKPAKKKIKKQAAREDGQLLILPSAGAKEAGALSGPVGGSVSMTDSSLPQSGEKSTPAAAQTPKKPVETREAFINRRYAEARNYAKRNRVSMSKAISRITKSANMRKELDAKWQAERGEAEAKRKAAADEKAANATSALVSKFRDYTGDDTAADILQAGFRGRRGLLPLPRNYAQWKRDHGLWKLAAERNGNWNGQKADKSNEPRPGHPPYNIPGEYDTIMSLLDGQKMKSPMMEFLFGRGAESRNRKNTKLGQRGSEDLEDMIVDFCSSEGLPQLLKRNSDDTVNVDYFIDQALKAWEKWDKFTADPDSVKSKERIAWEEAEAERAAKEKADEEKARRSKDEAAAEQQAWEANAVDLESAMEANDAEFAEALAFVEGRNGHWRPFTRRRLSELRHGDLVSWDGETGKYEFVSYDDETGRLVLHTPDVEFVTPEGHVGGEDRVFEITEDGWNEISDNLGEDENGGEQTTGQANGETEVGGEASAATAAAPRPDDIRAGNAQGEEGRGGGGAAQGGDFALESVSNEEIEAEKRRYAEARNYAKRQNAPLTGNAGEVNQTLLDLDGEEGEDLFSRTERSEQPAQAAAQPEPTPAQPKTSIPFRVGDIRLDSGVICKGVIPARGQSFTDADIAAINEAIAPHGLTASIGEAGKRTLVVKRQTKGGKGGYIAEFNKAEAEATTALDALNPAAAQAPAPTAAKEAPKAGQKPQAAPRTISFAKLRNEEQREAAASALEKIDQLVADVEDGKITSGNATGRARSIVAGYQKSIDAMLKRGVTGIERGNLTEFDEAIEKVGKAKPVKAAASAARPTSDTANAAKARSRAIAGAREKLARILSQDTIEDMQDAATETGVWQTAGEANEERAESVDSLYNDIEALWAAKHPDAARAFFNDQIGDETVDEDEKARYRSMIDALDARAYGAAEQRAAESRIADRIARKDSGAVRFSRGDIAAPTAADVAEAQRQYDAVLARYTNPDGTRKPGWMKAPNGEPTRLTERQWVQVRTPNFKKWFGDWEAATLRNLIEATQELAFLRPTGGLLAELVDGYRRGDPKIEKRIIDWAEGIIPQVVRNAYIGDIKTSRGNIRSILHHVRDARSRGPLKVLVLERMEEVLRNSVLLDEGADGGDYFYNLAHRMSFDGVPYIARLTVKKDRNGNMTYDVEFSRVDKLSNAPATGTGAPADAGANPAHSTTESLLQHAYFVKPENVSKVVDENGEPLVVYHDSGERHNVLSREYARKSMDIEAVYFHENRDEFHEYGPVEHAAFLNIRKPADFAKATEGFSPGSTYDAGVRQREKLQAQGYDGTWFPGEEMGSPELGELAVFEPTQIKSATDNVGKFDGERGDIRFSRVFDKDIIQEFNTPGKYITTYRSAVLDDDGSLLPPMATKNNGSMRIGEVYKSEEHPERVRSDGTYPLQSDKRDSGKSGTVYAKYNPYFHSQLGVINDQFSVANDKSRMVTVECRVLKSDIESGYKAEKAKDSVGFTEWSTKGPVAMQIMDNGQRRSVILSRYIMPMRILSREEEARRYKEQIGDNRVSIPENVLTPGLRDELKKLGMDISRESPSAFSWKKLTNGKRKMVLPRFASGAFSPDTTSAKMVKAAKESVRKAGGIDTPSGLKLNIPAFGDVVVVGKRGFIHGLRPYGASYQKVSNQDNADIIPVVGEILKNSIPVNEIRQRDANTSGATLLLGAAVDENGLLTPVVSVVEHRKDTNPNPPVVIYPLKSINTRGCADHAFDTADASPLTIMVSEFVKEVKDAIPIFSKDVYDHFKETRPKDDFEGSPIRFSRSDIAHWGERGSVEANNDIIREIRARAEADEPRGIMDGGLSRGDELIRRFQDLAIPVRRIEEALDIAPEDGVYRDLDLAYGKEEHALNDLWNNTVTPILAALDDQGLEWDDLSQYLEAKFAPVRNRLIEERTDGRRLDGSGMDDLRANAVLRNFKAAGKTAALDAVAQMVWKMNRDALQARVDAGLVSREDADRMLARGENYVPMQSDPDMVEDGFGPTGAAGGIGAKEYHAALGRSTLAGDPLALSIMAAQRSRARAIKNEVRQKLARLVQAHPELGSVLNGQPVKRTLRDGKVAYTVDRSFREKRRGEGDTGGNAGVVQFKEDGQLKYVVLNGRLGAEAAAAFTRSDEWTPEGWVWEKFSAFNRWLARTRTSLSPTFLVRNGVIDNKQVVFNMAADGFGAREIKEFEASLPSAWRSVYNYLKDGAFKGDLGGDMEEFVKAGGLIKGAESQGYADTMEKLAKSIARAKAHGLKKAALNAATRMELLNGTIETATRLAVFRAARQGGLSPEAAAAYARDITVNFNRKGNATSGLNTIYQFMNASVQDIERSLRSMTGRNGRNTGRAGRPWLALAGLFLSGMASVILSNLIGGDDDDEEEDYKNLPEYTKQSTQFLKLGKVYLRSGIRGPMALVNYMGVKAGELMIGVTSAKDAAFDLAEFAFETALDPLPNAKLMRKDGGGIDVADTLLNMFMPTAFQPLVQMGTNRSFTGDPLYGRKFNDYLPESGTGHAYTADAYKWMARTLNQLTGGDEFSKGVIDFAPETYQMIVETVLGGMGNDFFRTLGTIGNIANGELPVDRTPFLRDVVRSVPDNSRRYYEAKARQARWETSAKGYRAGHDWAKVHEFEAGHPSAKQGVSARLREKAKLIKNLREQEARLTGPAAERAHQRRTKLQSEYIELVGK